MRELINGLINKFDADKFSKIINEIDCEVPDHLAHYKIPQNRKQLIIKMITLRLQNLGSLIYEGV